MDRLVIDASVAFKWFLDDEEEIAQARQLFSEIMSEKIRILLPSLWVYEITNSFRSAVLKKRLSQQDAHTFTKELKTLDLPLLDCSFLMDRVITTAFHFSISAYDATYVALAEEESCSFVTGDKKLYNQLEKKVDEIIWIGNYR